MLVNRNLDDDAFTDSDSTLSTLTDRTNLRDESVVDGGVVSEPDNDTFSNLDVNTEEDADNETDSDIFSDTDGDADSEFDCQADDSSVTDEEYDVFLKRSEQFSGGMSPSHIIRSLVHGRPRLDNSQYTINAIEGFPATRITGSNGRDNPASSLSSLTNFISRRLAPAYYEWAFAGRLVFSTGMESG
jgi:hypothetical protein